MRAKRVYFLRPVGQLGPVKIGCSVFPEGRLDNFTLWSPMKLELVTHVPGSHADEKALHGMFAAHHLHGEWFGASKELLALIDHCVTHGALPQLPKIIKFPSTRHKAHTAQKPPPPDKRAWAARMRAEYENGATAHELAERHGVCHITVLRMVGAAGGKPRRKGRPATGPQDVERATTIARRYLGGETLQSIADDYGITRERVRQILLTMHITGKSRRAA